MARRISYQPAHRRDSDRCFLRYIDETEPGDFRSDRRR